MLHALVVFVTALAIFDDLGGILVIALFSASAAAGSCIIADLPYPPGMSVLLIVRDGRIIAMRGATALQAGDHVHVLCDPAERSFVQLIFGREETT
jgi:Trk K+ transport system NAD-binding subunit